MITLHCPIARPQAADPSLAELDALRFPAILLQVHHSGHRVARILDSESDLFYLCDDLLHRAEAVHGELYSMEDGVRLISSAQLYRWAAHDLNAAYLFDRAAYCAARGSDLFNSSNSLYRAADELGWEDAGV